MKIAFIGNNSGGMYRFRKELISRLVSDGHYVVVITPFDEHVEALRKCCNELIEMKMSRRGMNPLKDIKLTKNLLKMLRDTRPDYVITYTVKPNIYAGFACRVLKIPFASNITGLGSAFLRKGILQQLVVLMYRHSIRYANRVFVENSSIQSVLERRGAIRRGQVCVLNGAGVNLEDFSCLEYPDKNGVTNFLFIGRIMREKGVDELFSAMVHLVIDGYECMLDIVGSFDEDYLDKIEYYESQGWLRYHGYQNDVIRYIKHSHCLVMPSWHEGMANVNLEAAASGRPIITSNIPGCREAVCNGKTGLLCRKANADDLYFAMKRFIELPYEEKRKLGKCGREYIEKKFDKEKVVDKTIEFLFGR